MIKARYLGYSDKEKDFLALALSARTILEKEFANKEGELRSSLAHRVMRLRRRANERGVALGTAQALAGVKAQYLKAQADYEKTIRTAWRDSFDTAITLARHIVGEEIHASSKALEERLLKATQNLLDRRGIKVFLNPADCSRMRSSLLFSEAQLISSDEMPRGRAIIETLCGSLEFDLEKEFEALVQGLKEGAPSPSTVSR